MCFRLNPRWVFPAQPYFLTHSSSRFHSSVRGGEGCFNSPRFSSLPLISEESLVFLKDPPAAYNSTFLQTIENEYSIVDDRKINVSKRSPNTLEIMNDEANAPEMDDKSSSATTCTASKGSSFGLLLENLGALEETFVDMDAVRLEKDIVFQLGRLGALKLFNICLSRTLHYSTLFNLSDVVTHCGDHNTKVPIDTHLPRSKVFIRSTKKNERKRRREVGNPDTDSAPLLASETSQRNLKQSTVSCVKRSSRSRYRRSTIAKNEVEMAKGVKMLASLERVKETLEKETGRAVGLCCWAEAAGVDEKMLRQHLHFAWNCRDELLRSTRSLVLFLARNYWGLGIANEDLLQAGNRGVLQGAERFDHTRGHKFSTYVQYWIRKSMSRLVAQQARGTKIPCTLSRAINKIEKARKILSNLHGKHPEEVEIAKFTALSLSKIRSADLCLRVVGSIDQRVGDSVGTKYLELMPDMSMESPEDFVSKQHLKREIDFMLAGLDCRERQVIVLRHGLEDLQPKSLAEIGRLVNLSKEWIRKIEKKAMKKLNNSEKYASMKHFSVS